jgi:lipopolysaccharide export system permease protein
MFMLLGILLLILSTNNLIHFLEDAASGTGSFEMALKILALMLPQMIGVLLPISLFLAILSVFGKLFANSELLIMLSAGVNFKRLWLIAHRPTFVVILVTAVITLGVQPLMTYYENSIKNSLSNGSGSVSLIQSGQFVSLNQGKEIIYLGSHTKDNALVSNVFVYLEGSDQKSFKVIAAPHGHSWVDPSTHQTFMVLEKGYQYQGKENNLDYSIVAFDDYGFRTPSAITPDSNPGVDGMSTWKLFHEHSLQATAELQWRFSVPIVTWILALLAVGLSYLRPRQGRFGQFLPALLIFVMYFNLLVASRAWLESGVISPWVGLFWVHGVFALLGVLLLSFRDGIFFTHFYWVSWRSLLRRSH